MVIFSHLILNIVNMHDISYNEEVLLAFVQYDNSNIGNVHVVCKGGELEITKVVDVERHDDAYIIEMRLENL
jgi:hypothetical protein